MIHDCHVYLTTKAGVLHCLDLKAGMERYAERLSGQGWATPVARGTACTVSGRTG